MNGIEQRAVGARPDGRNALSFRLHLLPGGVAFVRVWLVGVLQTFLDMLETCPEKFVARQDGLLHEIVTIIVLPARRAKFSRYR
jgi:hypothetical protein